MDLGAITRLSLMTFLAIVIESLASSVSAPIARYSSRVTTSREYIYISVKFSSADSVAPEAAISRISSRGSNDFYPRKIPIPAVLEQFSIEGYTPGPHDDTCSKYL